MGDDRRAQRLIGSSQLVGIDRRQARFITLYLPALDVLLNRLDLPAAASAAQSRRVIDEVTRLVMDFRAKGYDIVLVGAPGNGGGHAVIGTTVATKRRPPLGGGAPTILDFLGVAG